VFQLYNVLRFDSTMQYNYVVINVQLNNQFFYFKAERINMLLG